MDNQNYSKPPFLPDLPECAVERSPYDSGDTDGAIANHLPSSGFDYGTVTADIAHMMRAVAERIHEHHRVAVIEVGRELLAIKAQIAHGHFVEWIERECEMSVRAAQRAMQVAEMVAKNDNLSYLPADGLLALAARSAPEPVVTGIMARIDAGERPSAADIKRQINTAKETKRATKEPRLAPERPEKRAHMEAAEERDEEQWRREQAERDEKAKAAAAILISRLGDQLEAVVELLAGADMLRVRSELREAHYRLAEKKVTDAPVSMPLSSQSLYARSAADLDYVDNDNDDTVADKTQDAPSGLSAEAAGAPVVPPASNTCAVEIEQPVMA